MVKQIKYIATFLLVICFGSQVLFCQSVDKPSIFSIKRVSFNSTIFSDIAPVIIKDGVLFCSDQRTSIIKNKTTFNDERLYNLFIVLRKDSDDWQKPKDIRNTGNNLVYYGPASVAGNGKTIYFTSGILTGKAARKKGAKNTRGIYIGDLNGTEIINIHRFDHNNQTYSVAQPSISQDGKYLFFASDMPGGQGGSDIYYCENINGKWGSPVNLGNKVNSSSRENYPFMHPSGRLYFTSDRRGGLGGLDIYYTKLSSGTWAEPEHLPADINSPGDDFAFVADENLQTGFFSSNRNRDDDIFRFTSLIIRKVKCDTLQINNFCYEFLEENAIKFDTIPFRYQWNFGDGTTAEGARAIHCYQNPGKYSVRLDVVNLVTKEIQNNEKTYDLEIKEIEQPYISGPDNGAIGKSIKFNADSTNLPGWNIVQYYWNFGDETIAIGKEVDKVYSKPGNYSIQLIVTAGTAEGGVAREACVSKNITVIR